MKKTALDASAVTVWNKLYHQRLYQKIAELPLMNGLAYGDDTVINAHAFSWCHKFSFVNQNLYYYRLRDDSVMFSVVGSIRYFKKALIAYNIIFKDIMTMSDKKENLHRFMKERLLDLILSFSSKKSSLSESEILELMRAHISPEYHFIIDDNICALIKAIMEHPYASISRDNVLELIANFNKGEAKRTNFRLRCENLDM